MSYTGPENPLESYAIPDVLNLLYQNQQATLQVLKQLQASSGTTPTSSSGGYPAVFALPTNFSNLMEILIAGGEVQGYTSSDYVVVPAAESASLTISVNPNDVLVFVGGSSVFDTAAPHNTGFLETITIDGVDFESDAAMLNDLSYDGAFVPPAKSEVVFTYQNTTSASITGAYQVQGALVNANTYTTQLLPTLQAQAQQLLQDGSALLP